MSVVLINFSHDSYLTKVAEQLCLDKKNEISWLVSHQLPTKDSLLNNLNFLDASFLYNKSNFSKCFNSINQCDLSFQECEKLVEAQVIVQKSIDRISPVTNSIHYTEEYFWSLCTYLKSFFLKKKITNIIFDAVPHLSFELTFFFVAKMMGIKTFILGKTSIASVSCILEDFRNFKLNWKFDYKDEAISPNFNLEKSENEIIDDQKESEFSKGLIDGQFPENKKDDIFRNYIKSNVILNKLYNSYHLRFLVILIRTLFEKKKLQKIGANYNYKLNSTFAFNENINRYDYIRTNLIYLKKNYLLKKKDSELLTDTRILENIDYIFYPLHFQPESSTLPSAMYFENQELIIRMLSKALPKNWKLVVKEHPKQLKLDLRNLHFRNLDFYQNIKNIDNVLFYSSSSDYSKIFKLSKINCSISGSIIWSSLLNGIPSIIFVDQWLSECKSVRLALSVEELIIAIEQLLKKKKINVHSDVIDFLNDHRSYFIDGIIYERHIRFLKSDINISIKNLAKAISKRVQRV